ncbi:hypothetical protein C7Y72_20070 [Paraconexibacter algicola]|uniref:4,4'-diaponeurosporenoate glycosyltransferase n=2 Tax=Paraconexibacter algicola TaxID=2133960 RepID=A0A2T4UCC2_9ACTN|nr:hypothetical protein C7Y72_20070 [Paraconexibacter algicola]
MWRGSDITATVPSAAPPGTVPRAMSPRTVSVVVPARNAAATLFALLDALAAVRAPEGWTVEHVLVDDRSTDATAALAAAHPLPVTVLASTGVGPAAARNRGAAHARGEVLAFTDADCAPTPDWLAAGLRALHDGAELVQGAVGPPPDVPVGPFDRTVRVGQPTQLYETANLLVTRARFDALGGFESWLGTATAKELGEDAWFGWRAVRAGARVAFAPDALVHHAVLPGTARSFVLERARLRFFPALVARIPELRDGFCFRRLFLTRRSAAFDLAAVATVAAVVRRRPWPLLAAVPYVRILWPHVRPWGVRRGPAVAAANVAADAVGAASLAAGSVRARTPLL